MTVLQYMATHADELSKCKSREEVFACITKGGVTATPEQFKAANDEINFLYKVLDGIFGQGKEAEAKKLYETIKMVVETSVPK